MTTGEGNTIRHRPSRQPGPVCGKEGEAELSVSIAMSWTLGCPQSDGLQVMFGPQSIGEFAEIGPDTARAIVGGLVQVADFVVVDMGCHPSAATEAVAGRCDFVVVVTAPEPTWMESVKVSSELMRSWNVPQQRLGMVVVNRVELYTGANMRDICSKLQCGIIGTVPAAPDDMLTAHQRARRLVNCEPDCGASLGLFESAERLAAPKIVPKIPFEG